MKVIGKKVLAWLLSVLLIAGCCVTVGLPQKTVSAAITSNVTDALDGTATDNISDNNYSTYYSRTVKSYIMENEDGSLTRVEYVSGTGVVVETYSAPGSPDSTLILEAELSVFGGFYAGEDYNFLVFGQNNSEESDEVEVLRIVKYDKDWNRVDACSVYGANTYIPFDAGSLRMTETNGSLYIHTCHEMYASSDGLHHQANMTFVMDISSMEITDSCYGVMNIRYGYVSHSFNQFIQTDGETIYRVDHGDAYPRGVALTAASVGKSITSVKYTTVLNIQGITGANATGVSVGGFELSADNCLIVGNSVDQSDADSYSASGQRNIFLTVTDKDLSDTEIIWLTDYTADDNITPRTPQLVKLSDDRFLILWEEYDSTTAAVTTKLVLVDGSGNLLSDEVSTYLRLSDCQPICTADGKVTWYVTDDAVTLYTIDPDDLESLANENPSGACGPNAKYELDLSTGTLTISGTGAMTEWSSYSSDPWYPYRDQITSVVIEDGITSIGNYAFSECSSLASITIPSSVTSIGNYAFSGCSGLNVYYAGSIESWLAISMGNTYSNPLRSSGTLYLEGYSAIFTLGTCGDELYYYLTENGTLTIFGIGAMSEWSSMISSIPWYSYRTQITSVVVEEGVTDIGNYAFYGCTNLTSITIPAGVTRIGAAVFSSCTALADVYYGGSEKEWNEITIDSGNTNLTNATIHFDLPFADVQDPDTYYYKAVQYVYSLGLMTGLDTTTFGPGETLSRAHFATILYRLAGSPSVEGMDNPFEDNQSADTFFYNAVIWCNNVGVITGYFNADGSFSGRFGPSDSITREQLATMLFRYANYVGEDTSASVSLDSFGDAASVSSFAAEALQWAAAEGIVSGRDTTPPTIAPQDKASRADAAVMLQRYLV